MKSNCEIVCDLLPLYLDGITSEASRQLVEEHLAECGKCKKLFLNLKKSEVETEIKEEKVNVIEKQRKAFRRESVLTGGVLSGIFIDADNYSVGDTSISEKVENIEIDWSSGTVNLVSHSDNTVLVSENIDSTATDDIRVHWWLDGTTLHVKFSAPGVKLRLSGCEHKELTLTVPDNFKLSNVTVTAASADVNVAGISAEKLDISTASGDMEIECEAEELCLNSASGEVTLNQVGVAEKVEIGTASGKISAVLEQTGAAVFGSASGDINIKASESDDLSVESTSGNISCEAAVIPQKCELHAVSGRVRLTLPENSGFVAKIKSTSGVFDSDFALKKDGSTYTSGDGSAELNIKTTSGDVTIRKKQ